MAEKKECEKSQNIVDEASEKEKKESLNQEPEVWIVLNIIIRKFHI